MEEIEEQVFVMTWVDLCKVGEQKNKININNSLINICFTDAVMADISTPFFMKAFDEMFVDKNFLFLLRIWW